MDLNYSNAHINRLYYLVMFLENMITKFNIFINSGESRFAKVKVRYLGEIINKDVIKRGPTRTICIKNYFLVKKINIYAI